MGTQTEMATSLIEEINKDIEGLEELTVDFLLDMMGVCGLEFKTGEAASLEFIEGLKA
jgi:hypothetical protein